MSKRALVVAVGSILAALLFSPVAGGARGWHPPVVLGAGLRPKVAVNASGVAAAAWLGADGAVQAAVRTRGAWSGAHALGPGAYEPPDVAVDAAGNVVVVWEGAGYVIQAGVKPAGGGWLPADQISAPGINWLLGAQVSVDGQGTATAVWSRPVAFGDVRVESAVRPVSAGRWEPPVEIGRGISPEVSQRFDGSAVAVWSASPGDYAVQAAARTPGGEWLAPVTLSGAAPGLTVHPKIAADGLGNATALWSRMGQEVGMALETRLLPFGSGWQPAETIATGRVFGQFAGISEPGLAVNAAGAAVTTWSQWDGNQWVRAAYRPAGSGWGQTQHLSQRGQVRAAVAIDPAGDALAVWSRSASTNLGGFVEASVRDVGTGIWTAPLRISAVGGAFPDVAADGSGDAVTVWSRYREGGTILVEAAEFAEGGTPPPPGPPPGPGPPPPDPPPGSPPPPGRCVVPRLIGLRLASARTKIGRSGCSVGRVRRVRSRRVPRGRVLAQSPRRGAIRRFRARVNLVVSRGRR